MKHAANQQNNSAVKSHVSSLIERLAPEEKKMLPKALSGLMLLLVLSWRAEADAADLYGAIAFSKEDGSYGSSSNLQTQRAVEDLAIQSCGN